MNPATRTGSVAGDRVVTRPGGGDLLTPPEVAALLRTTVGNLKRWRYVGDGPAFVKTGRSVRYRARDVDAWLDANTATRT